MLFLEESYHTIASICFYHTDNQYDFKVFSSLDLFCYLHLILHFYLIEVKKLRNSKYHELNDLHIWIIRLKGRLVICYILLYVI